MERQTLDTLEIGTLLGLLARHVQTPLGRKRALNLAPTNDRGVIDRALELTAECVQFLQTDQRFSLAGIEDPEASLARLQVEATILEPQQVLQLEHLATVGMGLRELFRSPADRASYPELAAIAGRIPDLRRLLTAIQGKVLPGGAIDDNASPELRGIRHQILARRNRIHRNLEAIMHQQTRLMQDEIITFRNGRFVIPVRTESRVHVPGVVHGLSSSGQTTYIEPLTVIEQNNDLVRLHEEEEIEITRILRALTAEFRAHRHSLHTCANVIAEIDLNQAKARLSLEFGCVRPLLSKGLELRLQDAFHILLEGGLRQSGAHAVPISLDLDDSRRILIVSGPNAGGKTVVLKTVGIISLMAQMGLHIPARSAVLPVFDQVFADIGDQQSIAANLSTFTAHMRNIAEMAQTVAPPALILLDEVGTGTDPEEGAALGIAIVDFFRRAGATTLATTHYNPLKMWASQTSEVINASVEFDERTLRPTYRLITGVAGASSGIEIARRMNVPEAILDQAEKLSNPDHTAAAAYLRKLKALMEEQESLRSALEEEIDDTTQRYAMLESEFARREEARREEFAAALARTSRDFEEQSEQLIKTLKDRASAERLRKAASTGASQLRRAGAEAARKMEKEIGLSAAGNTGNSGRPPGQPAELVSREPAEGDQVWVKPLSQAGKVDSIRADTITVSVGSLKFRARREDLQTLESAPAAPPGRRAAERPASELTLEQQFGPELNVIGLNADEALSSVDRFLDQAYFAGAETVRIIHGHGKGILRRAIGQYLSSHSQVEKFQLAPPNQGGSGATLVELKK